MSQVQTKWIADAAVTGPKLDSTAKQSVLESKLVAARRGVLNFTTSAALSDTVTTEVEAAAAVDTPQTDLVTGEGIYTGAVSGATDVKKVLMRATGTDQGIDDGTGDEAYAVLTEAAGVFTLSYKTAAGGNYTFSGATAIDFYFVEVQDMHSLKEDALLYQAVSGVIDADQTSVVSEIDQNVNDLITLSGVAENATDLGTFTGATIADNRNNKEALQDLETALELKADASVVTEIDGNVNDLITLSGVAENATDLGTFTGSTIVDNRNNKEALQDLETAHEAHLDGGANKHDASEIDYELLDASKNAIAEASDSVDLALNDLDAEKQNYMTANLVATANITLSGEQTIDGVTTSTSRVLVVGQTTQSENGLYVSAAGAWARAADLSKSSQFVAGQQFHILGGTDHQYSMFYNEDPVATVDTSDVHLRRVNGNQLDALESFVGQSSDSDSAPTYSSSNFASGNLEAAIGALDAAFGGDLSFVPTNYANPADNVQAHLQAIDTALASAGATDFADDVFRISDNGDASKKIAFEASAISAATVRTIVMPDREVDLQHVSETRTESFTLSAGDITNKYVDLANIPINAAAVQVFPVGGPQQNDGVDYDLITDGADIKRLSWSALGMDGVLAAADVLRVHYDIAG